MNLTLGKRIGTGFAAILVVLAILGGVSYYIMHNSSSNATILSSEYAQEMDVMADLQNAWGKAGLEIRAFSFNGEEKNYRDGKLALDAMRENLSKAKSLSQKAEHLKVLRANVDGMASDYEAYVKAVDKTYQISQDMTAAREVMAKAGEEFLQNAEDFLEAQETSWDKEVKTPGIPVAKLDERNKKVVEVSKIITHGYAIRMAVYRVLATRDVKYFEGVQERFEKVGKTLAEVSPMVHQEVNKKQLQVIAQSMETYKNSVGKLQSGVAGLLEVGKERSRINDNLNKRIDEIYTAAITQTIAKADDSAGSLSKGKATLLIGIFIAAVFGSVLAFAITHSITGPLSRLVERLTSGSEQSSAAAGQVSAASQSLAEGSSEQAASLEETSSSLEEMSSMTKRNSENAQNAKDLARETREAADIGAMDMQQMSSAMEAIKQSSNDISKIIKTIDEIAFQTNILALNAAVEAARAGEAGMGFAVVADEVRSLAQRSAQAAKETAEKIQDAVSKSEQGVEISSKVSSSLSQIVDKARKVDELVAEIAVASKEQNQGIGQINLAVSQMDKVTQSNAASAEETASAAEELNAQSEELKNSVDDLMSMIDGKGNKQLSLNKAPLPSLASHSSRPRHLLQPRQMVARPTLEKKEQSEQVAGKLTNRQSETSHENNGTNGKPSSIKEVKNMANRQIPLDGEFKDF